MTKKPRNRNLMLTIGLFVVLLSASVGRAQDKPLKKISWGVTSLSASNWIPWIAKDAKIYDKYGLDVDIVYLRGGSGDTSKAIIAGSIYAAPVTTATVMTANLSGADRTTVAHTVKAVQSRVVSRPERKRPEDIKGKRLASTVMPPVTNATPSKALAKAPAVDYDPTRREELRQRRRSRRMV